MRVPPLKKLLSNEVITFEISHISSFKVQKQLIACLLLVEIERAAYLRC